VVTECHLEYIDGEALTEVLNLVQIIIRTSTSVLIEMTRLTKLFEPIHIGKLEIKNRIVFPPVGTRFADVNGEATQRHVDHYAARARGGAGLLIVPWVRVEDKMERKTGRLRLDSDEYIRGLHEIVEAAHLNGSKIAIQLSQGGRAVTREEAVGGAPVSSSEAYCRPYGTTARALTVEEIEYLVEAFAAAAHRAKTAGFDAVEFHGASGYLISQFLSPYVNRRTDRYGGDPDRRMTFALEILERTRERVGRDYPLLMRISGDEFVEGGLTLEDNKFIAKRLAEAGVDCIDVTMGIVESYHKAMPPMAVPRGAYVHLASGIKEVVDVPVITVGRINDPLLAEKILEEEKADLVAMGRALLADPDLPNKARRGDLGDITPCIACNRCEMATSQNIHIRCTVNPCLGKEREYVMRAAEKPKRLLVVGGGPAGMTAATIAALRGHRVTLYEKQDQLGGQLILAGVPPHKDELVGYMDYLKTQLRKTAAETVLGEEVTPELVDGLEPDAVVVATGARQIAPRIPGIDGSNVVYAWDVLRGEAEVEDRVVVVGGGMVGCETAEHLAHMGRHVRIVEMLPEIGWDMEPFSKIFLLERFREYGVEALTSAKVEEIHEGGVEAIDKSWGRHSLDADTVVIAVGSRPEQELYSALQGRVEELYRIGDCREPRRLLEAVHEATHVAHRI